MLVGNFLIVTGMGLLAVWARYFLDLVIPIDLWDISPLPVAIATILIGVKIAPALPRYCFKKIKATSIACLHVSGKRSLAIAFAAGGLMELTIWFLGYFLVTQGPASIWLARLQEPGIRVAYFAASNIFKPPKYPWSAYIGSACGFAVLIAMWSAIALALFWSAKCLTATRKSN